MLELFPRAERELSKPGTDGAFEKLKPYIIRADSVGDSEAFLEKKIANGTVDEPTIDLGFAKQCIDHVDKLKELYVT